MVITVIAIDITHSISSVTIYNSFVKFYEHKVKADNTRNCVEIGDKSIQRLMVFFHYDNCSDTIDIDFLACLYDEDNTWKIKCIA